MKVMLTNQSQTQTQIADKEYIENVKNSGRNFISRSDKHDEIPKKTQKNKSDDDDTSFVTDEEFEIVLDIVMNCEILGGYSTRHQTKEELVTMPRSALRGTIKILL